METFVLVSGKPEILKDPDATLDYSEDWTAWLAAASVVPDTIASATAVTASLTASVDSVSFNTTKVTAWVSGGAVGEKIALVFQIVTAGGRTDERTLYLKVKDR